MIVQKHKIIAAIFCLFISTVAAVAQDASPPVPMERSAGGPTPPGFPIDNGVLLLFAVALIFGVYKILKLSKKDAKT